MSRHDRGRSFAVLICLIAAACASSERHQRALSPKAIDLRCDAADAVAVEDAGSPQLHAWADELVPRFFQDGSAFRELDPEGDGRSSNLFFARPGIVVPLAHTLQWEREHEKSYLESSYPALRAQHLAQREKERSGRETVLVFSVALFPASFAPDGFNGPISPSYLSDTTYPVPIMLDTKHLRTENTYAYTASSNELSEAFGNSGCFREFEDTLAPDALEREAYSAEFVRCIALLNAMTGPLDRIFTGFGRKNNGENIAGDEKLLDEAIGIVGNDGADPIPYPLQHRAFVQFRDLPARDQWEIVESQIGKVRPSELLRRFTTRTNEEVFRQYICPVTGEEEAVRYVYNDEVVRDPLGDFVEIADLPRDFAERFVAATSEALFEFRGLHRKIHFSLRTHPTNSERVILSLAEIKRPAVLRPPWP